jgi:hypothetical protein
MRWWTNAELEAAGTTIKSALYEFPSTFSTIQTTMQQNSSKVCIIVGSVPIVLIWCTGLLDGHMQLSYLSIRTERAELEPAVHHQAQLCLHLSNSRYVSHGM